MPSEGEVDVNVRATRRGIPTAVKWGGLVALAWATLTVVAGGGTAHADEQSDGPLASQRHGDESLIRELLRVRASCLFSFSRLSIIVGSHAWSAAARAARAELTEEKRRNEAHAHRPLHRLPSGRRPRPGTRRRATRICGRSLRGLRLPRRR
ncbi:hypothetical protein DC434_19895 [Microbacterium sp. TPD7012]|nr:hypothetical protein DC434_19895 [Microbacterium sp. TPD7012]